MQQLSWRIIPFIIFIGLVFFLGRGLFLDPQILPSAQIGKSIPNFELPQLFKPQHLFKNNSFKNQVVFFNVWASWCVACSQEQVLLLKLASEGVPIYGLNYQDDPKAAKQWLAIWGNPYRMIGSDSKGRLAIDLGVYGAPETFLIDKKGIIRYKHVGILTESIWSKKILPMKQILEVET
jgi:cytochrome c biogenesis protein CcmG/thiol:disulfide interchange protein DsbE